MIDTPIQPPPPRRGDETPALSTRRIYFEQLTAVLLSSGVSGEQVGRLVAELDGHVALSGRDPVDELGPVGELAGALRRATGPRHLALLLACTVALGVSVSLTVGAVMALLGGGEVRSIPLGIVVQTTTIALGATLLKAFGYRSLTGRRTLEWPSWPALAAYVVPAAAATTLAYRFSWGTSTGVAVAVAIGAGSTAVVMGRWYLRHWRVPVPGDARHLRHLGWGHLGRR